MGVSTSGSNVTQWNDQSSFANNLTNTGTASNVTFSSSSFNSSHQGISIVDNSNGNMQIGGNVFPAATPGLCTLFMLTQPNTSTTGCRWGWLANVAGNDAVTPSFVCYENGANKLQTFSGSNLSSLLTMTNGTPTLVGVVFDGVNATEWQNGTAQASSGYTSALGSGSIGFGIGGNSNANGAGSVYAFWGITQKVMNTTDWGNLKTWSNTNWGTSF